MRMDLQKLIREQWQKPTLDRDMQLLNLCMDKTKWHRRSLAWAQSPRVTIAQLLEEYPPLNSFKMLTREGLVQWCEDLPKRRAAFMDRRRVDRWTTSVDTVATSVPARMFLHDHWHPLSTQQRAGECRVCGMCRNYHLVGRSMTVCIFIFRQRSRLLPDDAAIHDSKEQEANVLRGW